MPRKLKPEILEQRKKQKLLQRKQNFIKTSNIVHNNKYDYSKICYVNNVTFVEVICPKHGSFMTQPNKHSSKTRYGGCPECYRELNSHSVEFVKKEIEKKGGILLDPMSDGKNYIKTQQRIKVQCDGCKKIWTPKWHNLRVKNRWCGICTGKYKNSYSFDYLDTIAKELGSKVLQYPDNPIPFLNMPDNIEIQCNVCDHIEKKTFRAVFLAKKHKLNNCSNCSSFSRPGVRTFEQVKQITEKYNFKILKYPDNGKIKKAKERDDFVIQCPNGHTQETNCHNIFLNGIWRYNHIPCSQCNNKSYREQWTREVLEEIFSVPFPSDWPDWLRNPKTGHRLELDCYNSDLQLAVEYQGRQHYEPVKFFGGLKSYEDYIYRDKIKTNLCQQQGIVLWRFDNRKFAKRGEKEFKQEIKKSIFDKMSCNLSTPSWNKNSEKIKFYLTT